MPIWLKFCKALNARFTWKCLPCGVKKINVKSGVAATGDSRMSVLPPEGISPESLPLLDRFSLRIGLLFRGTLVLLSLPIIGPERLTIVVDALTWAIVISRTPEILIAHLKGIHQNTVLVWKLCGLRPNKEMLKTKFEYRNVASTLYLPFGGSGNLQLASEEFWQV